MTKPIPVFRPWYGEEELEALREPIMSGWIGLGPKVEEFEEKFAEYVGAKYAVATNSGTAALHLACSVIGLKPGDDVIVPAISFISTALAPTYRGCHVTFADVFYGTLNMNYLDLMKRINPNTRAIIPVHFGGHPCAMDTIKEIAGDIPIIEDAAHACGANYKGKKIGSCSHSLMACFSFHAVKNLATGDGGMITTNDASIARKLKSLRWCGIYLSTWERSKSGTHSWYYKIKDIGYKAHMNDLAAALGLVQLAKLDRGNTRRREIASEYTRVFGGLPFLFTPPRLDYGQSSYHNYVVKVFMGSRDELHEHLRERGISSSVHYPPMNEHPIFADERAKPTGMASEVSKKILTLPMYPGMSDGDVERVIRGVEEYGEQFY